MMTEVIGECKEIQKINLIQTKYYKILGSVSKSIIISFQSNMLKTFHDVLLMIFFVYIYVPKILKIN